MADQEVQRWRLGKVQRAVGITYVPYDPSVETPDAGGTNGRLARDSIRTRVKPSRAPLAVSKPRRSLLEPQRGRPDLCGASRAAPTFGWSMSIARWPLLRHQSLARDRMEIVKPRCALNAASRHNIAAQRLLPILVGGPSS